VLDPLFSGISIGQALDDRRRKALKDNAAQPSGVLLEQHLDELVAERVENWRIDPLVLNWDDRKAPPSDIEIEVDSDVDREISDRTQPATVTGMEITFFVPFIGMPGLFHWRPSTHTGKPPRGFVLEERRLLSYSGFGADDPSVRRDLDQQEAAITQWVSWVNRDVGAFNAELPGLLRGALQARLDKVRAGEDLVAALGVPRAAFAVPRAALGVPRRQRPRSRRGHIEANAAEPSNMLDQSGAGLSRTPGRSDPAESFRAPPAERRQANHPGRPVGSGWLIANREELLDKYRKARQQAGRRPGQREFARALTMSVRTMCRYLIRFDLPWPPE
jgi:hypothetical protein